MLNQLRLSKKVPMLVVGAAALVGIGIGTASYLTSVDSIHALTEQRLAAAAKVGITETTDYLHVIEHELRLIAEHPGTVVAVKEFAEAWKAIEAETDDPVKLMQDAYIENNPNPTGEKHLLDKGSSHVAYDALHAKYHPWFRELQQVEGYYDVFLFDTEGNLVYSVFKELDYATNFKANGGQWASSDLGKVYREVMELKGHEAFAFADFAPYGPSYDAPASFMAHGIHDKDGNTVGVLAFQMPVDRINALMAHDLGLGKSGELIFVGADGYLRNDSSSTADKNDILATKIDSPILDEAFAKGNGFGYGRLFRDEDMVIDAASFEFHGNKFAVVAMQSLEESEIPVVAIRNQMLLAGGLMLALAAVAGLFAARTVTRPINEIVGAMGQLADGKHDLELDQSERLDEIGDMIRCVKVFRENAIERVALEEASQLERDKERQRQAHMETVIASFRGAMTERLATVSEQMGVMRSSSEMLNTLAENASGQAGTASNSSESASNNVATVASATEEMSASVQEVAHQTHSTSEIVMQTVEATENTNRNVSDLSKAADRVGSIVNLIRDIAEQTNLLALNATIEAARAGDAGRGFAVVASEVKALAEQTSKATDEISTQISGIQGSVKDAADAIGDITSKVNEIRSLTTVVSSAVEEQHAATQEIAQSAKSASDSTQNSSHSIIAVTEAIEKTSKEADMVNSASDLVSEASQQLAKDVERFLLDVVQETEDRREAMRIQGGPAVKVIDSDGKLHPGKLNDLSTHGAQLVCARGVYGWSARHYSVCG